MTEKEETAQRKIHKKFAIDLFNFVWTLLDKQERTVQEDDKMVHAAHASRFHWGEIGTPIEFARGEWQISRVYSVLNRPQAALYHAQRCLAICTESQIGDFDIAFAHEAIARAFTIAGAELDCRQHIELAQMAGEQIKDKEDRDYFFSELKSITCGHI